MGHSPKYNTRKTPAQVAKQRNRHSLVAHENLAHLLPSTKLMIIARENSHIHHNHATKRVSQMPTTYSSCNQIYFSSSHIHITIKHVMTLHSIHYDSTRLIRIRITWSDSADARTCGEYPCSTLSCSSPSYVLQVLR